MRGIFELKTAAHLLAKLQWEYDTLRSEPTNSYVAYNFFVTSWHLLEWLYPGQKAKREQMRDQEPVLQVCEHLAVGAKHFEPANQRLESVTSTGRFAHWPRGFWHPNHWGRGHWRDSLMVELAAGARERFGAQMDVLPLADEVMKFWASNEDLRRQAT